MAEKTALQQLQRDIWLRNAATVIVGHIIQEHSIAEAEQEDKLQILNMLVRVLEQYINFETDRIWDLGGPVTPRKELISV